MKFAWKEKEELKSKPGSGEGVYHALRAATHLENHCNESGRASMEQRLIERSSKRSKCEDEVAPKTEQHQEEADSAESKRKRGGVTQQQNYL